MPDSPAIHDKFDFSVYQNNPIFKYIKIADLKFDNLNPCKKIKNIKEIHVTGKVFPIELNENDNEYEIIDGRHRSNACLELGYKEIPAVVYQD